MANDSTDLQKRFINSKTELEALKQPQMTVAAETVSTSTAANSVAASANAVTTVTATTTIASTLATTPAGIGNENAPLIAKLRAFCQGCIRYCDAGKEKFLVTQTSTTSTITASNAAGVSAGISSSLIEANSTKYNPTQPRFFAHTNTFDDLQTIFSKGAALLDKNQNTLALAHFYIEFLSFQFTYEAISKKKMLTAKDKKDTGVWFLNKILDLFKTDTYFSDFLQIYKRHVKLETVSGVNDKRLVKHFTDSYLNAITDKVKAYGRKLTKLYKATETQKELIKDQHSPEYLALANKIQFLQSSNNLLREKTDGFHNIMQAGNTALKSSAPLTPAETFCKAFDLDKTILREEADFDEMIPEFNRQQKKLIEMHHQLKKLSEKLEKEQPKLTELEAFKPIDNKLKEIKTEILGKKTSLDILQNSLSNNVLQILRTFTTLPPLQSLRWVNHCHASLVELQTLQTDFIRNLEALLEVCRKEKIERENLKKTKRQLSEMVEENRQLTSLNSFKAEQKEKTMQHKEKVAKRKKNKKKSKNINTNQIGNTQDKNHKSEKYDPFKTAVAVSTTSIATTSTASTAATASTTAITSIEMSANATTTATAATQTAAAAIKQLLNPRQFTLLQDIFSDPIPHHKICYEDVVNLIEEGFKGKVETNGGSHGRLEMVSLGTIIDFIDLEPEDLMNDSNTPDITNTNAANTVVDTLVKPHKPGHNAKTLSRNAVKSFRLTLERAKFTPEIIATAAKTATSENTHGKLVTFDPLHDSKPKLVVKSAAVASEGAKTATALSFGNFH